MQRDIRSIALIDYLSIFFDAAVESIKRVAHVEGRTLKEEKNPLGYTRVINAYSTLVCIAVLVRFFLRHSGRNRVVWANCRWP